MWEFAQATVLNIGELNEEQEHCTVLNLGKHHLVVKAGNSHP